MTRWTQTTVCKSPSSVTVWIRYPESTMGIRSQRAARPDRPRLTFHRFPYRAMWLEAMSPTAKTRTGAARMWAFRIQGWRGWLMTAHSDTGSIMFFIHQ